jgi:aldehyde oxidoreductase
MPDFWVNGKPVSVADDHPHLLSALRDDVGVTSPKDGCSPQGQCGCCTVLVDGKAQISCTLDVAKVEGRHVTTLEGFSDEERTTYSEAFAAHGGLQCGFCIPGIVVRAKYLVDKKGADLTRDDLQRHMGAHLCRCTGYVKVFDAIEAVAQGSEIPVAISGAIGGAGAKYEAEALALGDRGYIDDMVVDNMAHAALHLTAHTRADIVAIDTTAALAAPGVTAVFTAADIPGDLRVGIIYTDWPVMIPVGGRTSYAGDVLAVVVAETRRQARAAAELIDVTYDVLTPVVDPVAALADGADIAVWGTDTNELSRSTYARGDVDSALAQSAHVAHETFQTQRIEHAFLEPESTLAVPSYRPGTESPGEMGIDQRTLYVYSGGQGVWDDRNQIAAMLGVERDQVTVELVSNGGAFGGKEDMSNQGHTALAAWLLDRPVKCTLSREESFLMHAKRHPIGMEYWAGCDEDGRLTGLRVRMIGDSGPYASVGMKVLERAAGHAVGAVPSALDRRRLGGRTHEQPGVRSVPRFRRQPGTVRDGRRHGPPRRQGRDLRLGDPQAQRDPPGEVWGPGQIMDDGSAGAEVCLDEVKDRYDAASPTARSSGSGSGSRTPASATGSARCRGRSSASARRTVASRCGTAGPRWARACTRWRSRSPPRSSASTPTSST